MSEVIERDLRSNIKRFEMQKREICEAREVRESTERGQRSCREKRIRKIVIYDIRN
jgi:hypothetical protein